MTGRLDRRTFLRASLVGATAAFAAAACAPVRRGPVASPPNAPSRTSETTTPRPSSSQILLACFSRPGENYWYGGRRILSVGNTEVLAGMLADRLGCDLYRVQAQGAYTADYEATVARNVREQQQDARPAISGALPDIRGYHTVILASPIWNVRPPMIMSTLVEALDLTGKTILPVTTHAMSGLGQSRAVYATLAPGANLGDGLAVRGEEVTAAGRTIDDWVARNLTENRAR